MKTILRKDGLQSCTQLRMIMACISKESARPAIRCLCVDSQGVIATNGHVMARMDNVFSLDTGLYKVEKNTQSKIMLVLSSDTHLKFPAYQNILDQDADTTPVLKQLLINNLPVDLYNIARADFCINPDYLAIFESPIVDLEYKIYASDHPMHLHGKDNNFHAVVMPVNPEKEG